MEEFFQHKFSALESIARGADHQRLHTINVRELNPDLGSADTRVNDEAQALVPVDLHLARLDGLRRRRPRADPVFRGRVVIGGRQGGWKIRAEKNQHRN